MNFIGPFLNKNERVCKPVFNPDRETVAIKVKIFQRKLVADVCHYDKQFRFYY